ncbi:phytase [Zhouia amylolytica]|uniref:phytase n=1 Tax=Zhouia amylolytica TaxID=376730 RepID=UPI0020CEFAAB|nr:phytase [Zhouia amylolytica]MCQ0111616.1 phytase [Zhouia amylolytica]
MIKRITSIIGLLGILVVVGCEEKLPPVAPDVITEKVNYDTDDPAIWINPANPSESVVFGTDKDTDGAIYAFDLEGKVIEDMVIRGIRYPNNVDVAYNFRVNDSSMVDIIAFTERERGMLRLFSVPNMKPLDRGGYPVFEDEENPGFRRPMGISLYKNPDNGLTYAIVSRKNGPKENYLYQYLLYADSLGVHAKLERKFGNFSGIKEIEAIAVDDENGYVYYSDEGVAIRKYHANPEMGATELASFGGEYFKDDIEGIAIAKHEDGGGYIIVSDQQKGQFNIFSRKENRFVKAINLSTTETDGCEVVTYPLNKVFSKGLFVAMNDDGTFYFYNYDKLQLE